MIFYRGTGILTFVFIGLIYNIAIFINKKVSFFQASDEFGSWLYIVIFLLSAVVLWIWGHIINSGPPQTYVDEKTGQKLFYKPKHDCFGIGFKPWAYIMMALAAANIGVHYFSSY